MSDRNAIPELPEKIEDFEISESEEQGDYSFDARVNLKAGKFNMDVRMKHPGFVAFIDDVARFFRDSAGIDYVTFDGLHPDLGCLSITIQRLESQVTPATKIAELTAALESMRTLYLVEE